jgi:hypothetical protein
MRMTRVAVLGAVTLMGAVLAGCTSGADTTPTVFVTLTPSATPSATAAATPVPTNTNAPAHVYTEGDQHHFTAADGAEGSGCAPGAGALPDGVWFGVANSWSTSVIKFDLACFYVGAKADEVAAARGEEAFGFLITNDNTQVRSEPVGAGAFGHKAATEDGVFSLAQIIADPGGSLPTAAPYPVWLFVNGGVVTEVSVQYLP